MGSPISAENRLKRVARHRPAEVSIRLLSNRTTSGQTENISHTFVFLMDTPELAWISQGVHRIMTQGGYSCKLHQLDEISIEEQKHHDPIGAQQFRLLPTTSAALVENCSFDHVVLVIPADLEAVLTAYQNIARLARRNTPDIAVILVGASDQNSAWHHFRKLATGAIRYLGIHPLNLGYIPARVPRKAVPADPYSDICLAPIVERLLRSEFYTTQPVQAST